MNALAVQHLDEAATLFKHAMQGFQKAGEADSPHFFALLQNLASLSIQTGLYKEAEQYLWPLLSYQEKHLGKDSPEVANTLVNLAGVMGETSRIPDSKPFYERALPILEKHLPSDDAMLQAVRNNLELLADTEGLVMLGLAFQENYYKGMEAFGRSDKVAARRYPGALLAESRTRLGGSHQNVRLLQERLAEVEAFEEDDTYLSHIPSPRMRWSDDTRVILVRIEPGNQVRGWKPHYHQQMQQALLEWQQALENRATFRFVEQPDERADVTVRWFEYPPKPEVADEEGDLGHNITARQGRYFVQNDIHLFLNDLEGEPQPEDELYSTMLHEAGHMMGLSDHSPNPSDVMYSYGADDWKPQAHLSGRDIATIRGLYQLKAELTNPPGGLHLSRK